MGEGSARAAARIRPAPSPRNPLPPPTHLLRLLHRHLGHLRHGLQAQLEQRLARLLLAAVLLAARAACAAARRVILVVVVIVVVVLVDAVARVRACRGKGGGGEGAVARAEQPSARSGNTDAAQHARTCRRRIFFGEARHVVVLRIGRIHDCSLLLVVRHGR